MTENTTCSDHERVSLLLPWFVNNTLDSAERDVVRHHIVDCGECREQVSLLSSIQSAVSKSSPTPIVPNANVAKFLKSIDREETTLTVRQTPRRVIALAASIVTAVVVITMILVYQSQTQQLPTRFQTATSLDQVAAMDYVLNIRFSTGTAAIVRDQVLQDINAKDIALAEGDDIYRVTVSLQMSSLEDLERYTDDVESLRSVHSVDVVAMQLPLRAPE